MNRLKAKALTKVASQAWAYDQRHRSIVLLTEALRRDPSNTEILINLATAFGKQRQYEKAEELLARVLEFAPRKASMHRRVAQSYAEIDRPERAVESYRRSLELNRDTSVTVATLLELASLYERRHQLEDADVAVQDALRRDPNNEHAQLQHALLFRRRGESSRAEMAFRSLVTDASHTVVNTRSGMVRIGSIARRARRVRRSYEALLEAKKLISPHAQPAQLQNREVLKRNLQLIESLDKSCYERWRAAASNDHPYRIAAITSHPRSGTTLVEQLLDSHDQVISADEFDVFAQ